MKQNLLLAAITAVAVMTGCSKNEVLEHTPTGEQNKMEFSPVVGKTRATEIVSADLQKNGTTLNLYGYKTSENFNNRNAGTFESFFDGTPEALTFNGYWSTARDYEWTALDGGLKLSIFTYFSPRNTLTGINPPTKSAAANFEYTVSQDIADQEDLLVATHLDMTKASTGGLIAINFKHALSQLYFRAKLTGTGYKAVIKSIKVLGAANKSTFTYSENAIAEGAWALPTGTSNYIYAEAFTQDITSKDNPVRIAPEKGSLMLMPQPVNAGTFQFEVTYDVFSPDGAILLGSRIVKTADMAALEMGKKYVYTLVLPASENDKIAFDVVVSKWDDASVASEREIRFDEYKLAGTADDAQALADLITGYTPTVIYLQEVKVTGDALNSELAIALSGLSSKAKSGSKVILDCTITDWTGGKITVSAPGDWTADKTEIDTDGKITITKK